MSVFQKAETIKRWRTPPEPLLPIWWDRFWRNVDKRGPRECWNWTASTRRGYGRLRIGSGKQASAHRLVMEAEFGSIPPGCIVRHSCDNPLCVNPLHLSIGMPLENMNDKARRGRVRGERNSRAILTEAEALAIRSSREPLKVLAERYGVARVTIMAIRYRRNWRHLQ